MSSREEEFLKRLQATFRIEAEEHLRAMSNGLLLLETNPEEADSKFLEDIYRDAHSLKGAARAVNNTNVEGICQSLESVLSQWKRGHIQAAPALFDTLNNALSVISHLLDLPSEQRADVGPDAYSEILNSLQEWEKGGPIAQRSTAPTLPTATEQSGVLDAEDLAEPTSSEPPVFNEPPALEQPSFEGVPNSWEAHRASGESTPASNAPPNAQISASGSSTIVPVSPPEITGRPAISPPSTARLSDPASAPVTAERTSAMERTSVAETVRIATSKLDSLLLQTEELLSAKQALAQRAGDLNEVRALVDLYERQWSKAEQELKKAQFVWGMKTADGVGATGETLDFQQWNRNFLRLLDGRLATLSGSLEQDCRALNAMVDTLLDDMKQVLMMPFSSLFELLPRLVRDLTRSLGKEALLEIQGSEIEIDRRILEEMKDPLIHLIRNAIDHGLESTNERVEQGKPTSGKISILVQSYDSGRVEIAVSDDGAGIDSAKVRTAAIEKGVISAEEALELSDEQALMLIFQSEVSTSSIITDVSGRGLGMAIVRDKVEKIGGHISIDTHIGRGTSFRIVLPLTLATFRGILLSVSQRLFIIPTASVERVLRLSRDGVKEIGGQETVVVDGQTVSLVGLHDVLELPSGGDESSHLTIVVLGSGEQRIAFQIGKIIDEQEVLVKSLGRQLLRVRNIAGATVLGSGQVVPILHVNDLLKSALRSKRIPSAVAESPALVSGASHSQAPKPAILIAEDSITSRMLIKNILESSGYRVKTTVDGAEALAALQEGTFSLVVSDVEMPRMDGFELTEKIRSDKRNGDLPVILVTSLGSREHRERGMDVGANAYIVKSSFDQGNLLDAVRRLIAGPV